MSLCSGPGIASVTPTSTNLLVATGGGGSQTVTFNVKGNGSSSGNTLSFLASDAAGNNSLPASVPYTAGGQPFTISEAMAGAGYMTLAGTGKYAVTVTPATGFSGSVKITPVLGFTGSVTASVDHPNGITVPVSSAQSVTVTFTVTVGADASSFTIDATAQTPPGSGTFSATTSNGPIQIFPQAPYTLSMPNSTAHIYSSLSTNLKVTVTYAAGFSGSVTVMAPTNWSNVTVSPSSANAMGTTVLIFAATGSPFNPPPASSDGNNSFTANLTGSSAASTSASISQSYTLVDPFSVSLSAPTSFVPGTQGSFTATVKANDSFSGSVILNASDSVNSGGLTAITNGQQSGGISPGNPMTFTFNLTPPGNTAMLQLSVTGTTGAYTSPPVTTAATVAAARSITITSGPISLFSGQKGTVTAKVDYASGWVGSVTVSVPSSAPAGLDFTNTMPVVAPMVSPFSAVLSLAGSNSNPSATSGTLTLTGTDTASNSNAVSQSYSVVDPYTVTSTVPTVFSGGGVSGYTVTITPNAGFTGKVTVTPHADVSSSRVSLGGSQTVTVVGMTTVTFSVTVNSGIRTFNLSANASTTYNKNGQFTLPVPPAPVDVSKPFSISVSPQTLSIMDSATTQLTTTVAFVQGYMGTVSVSCGNNLGSASAQSVGRSAAVKHAAVSTVLCSSGTGIGSVLVDGSGGSVAFVSSPSGNGGDTANVVFDVTGSGSGSGALDFVASDNAAGITATAKQKYTATGPAAPAMSPASLHREGTTMVVRNETCAGVHLASGSQSSCGGRADIEIQPALSTNGRLQIQMSAQNGVEDMGAMPSASWDDAIVQITKQSSVAIALQSRADFQMGHVYLVKSGSKLALVRVAGVKSSLDPRLAASLMTPGGGRRNGPSAGSRSGDLVTDMRMQDQLEQVLNHSQITIGLEWVQIDMP